MTEKTDVKWPPPVRFADYKGKVEADLGSMRGPNTLGEYMGVVEVRYNGETDTTRIGFAFTGQSSPDAIMQRWLSNQRMVSEAVRNNGL